MNDPALPRDFEPHTLSSRRFKTGRGQK